MLSFEWDPAKAATNLAKHGVSFGAVRGLDLDNKLVEIDDRRDYGEVREVAYGLIDDQIHVLVFTRRGIGLRVISLRKTGRRETAWYHSQQDDRDG